MNIDSRPFKTILNVKKSADSWFWDRYSINPFQGCHYGCVYCNARSSRYGPPEDFDTRITVKEGAAAQLHKRISRARKLLPDVTALSGATDPYQPAERRSRTTRALLEVLCEFGWPVHIITRSPTVVEDSALLQAIAQKSWAAVSFSIPLVDRELYKRAEPKAPTPRRRFEALSRLKREAPDVLCSVNLMPVLPFLGDGHSHLQTIINQTADHGADCLLFAPGMTLCDGQAQYYLRWLQKNAPKALPLYHTLFNIETVDPYRGSYSNHSDYAQSCGALIAGMARKSGLALRLPRFIPPPEDHRHHNYRLSERLFNRAWQLQLEGRYHWHEHNAARAIQDNPLSIVDTVSTGGLNVLLKGVRRQVVKEVFDYVMAVKKEERNRGF